MRPFGAAKSSTAATAPARATRSIGINTGHLHEQGLTDCYALHVASASTEGSEIFSAGDITKPQTWYPVIDHGDMNNTSNDSWCSAGLPLVGATGPSCVAHPINGAGSTVQTEYVATGPTGQGLGGGSDFGPGGAIGSEYRTKLCWSMTQGTAWPVADPACLQAWLCGREFGGLFEKTDLCLVDDSANSGAFGD